jgi:NADPH:quinone reductase-like Zn-dependent oxidoreductase
MKAAVVAQYGPPEVIGVQTVADPVAGKGRVVVRVHAAALSSGDARIRGARFPRGFAILGRLALGLRGPRRSVLGVVFSGVVEQVGSRITDVAVGDEVCGMTGVSMGAHAELVSVKAGKVVPKPAAVSHADAAGILFGGTTAMHFLGDRVRPGTTVLVNGASGAVGSAAVQLAALAGGEVTGVCGPTNADLVRRLGAKDVIDHTTASVLESSERYELVMDTVGTISLAAGRRLLAPGGTLLLVAADLADTVRARGDAVAGPASEDPATMAALLDLVASGELEVVIDRTVPLDEIVEAHRVVDSGRKVGNIVVLP